MTLATQMHIPLPEKSLLECIALGPDPRNFKYIPNFLAHFRAILICAFVLSSYGNFASYEPELFPGLIYRMMEPKIVLLIFVSGKVVLTGAKVCDCFSVYFYL